MKINLKCLLKFETENSPLADPPESQALFPKKIKKNIKIALFCPVIGIVMIKLETKQINLSDIYTEFLNMLIFQISMVTTLMFVIYVTSMKIHHWFLKPSSSILILLLPTVKQVSIRDFEIGTRGLLNLGEKHLDHQKWEELILDRRF